jgi:hypothetical protein
MRFVLAACAAAASSGCASDLQVHDGLGGRPANRASVATRGDSQHPARVANVRADETGIRDGGDVNFQSAPAGCGEPRPLSGAEIHRLLSGMILRPNGLVRAPGESSGDYRARRARTAPIPFAEHFQSSGRWSMRIDSAVPLYFSGMWSVTEWELCVRFDNAETSCRRVKRDLCGNLEITPMGMIFQRIRAPIRFDVHPIRLSRENR